jgi:hypothetical protein
MRLFRFELLLLAALLVFSATTYPQTRWLTDSNVTTNDPSTTTTCINATALGCNFTDWCALYGVTYDNQTDED